MSPRGRVIISGEKISDWKITFNGYKENLETLKIQNHLGLSGCLTLLDLNVDNISIEIDGAMCEDGVNFVRVIGEIDNVVAISIAPGFVKTDMAKSFIEEHGEEIVKNIKENSKKKLAEKNCDWIIANDVSNKRIGFDSDFNEISIFYKNENITDEKIYMKKKSEISDEVVERVLNQLN